MKHVHCEMKTRPVVTLLIHLLQSFDTSGWLFVLKQIVAGSWHTYVVLDLSIVFSPCASHSVSCVFGPPLATLLLTLSLPAFWRFFFFLSFSLEFHGPPNIFLYEYLNMHYFKIKIRASTLKIKLLNKNMFYSSFKNYCQHLNVGKCNKKNHNFEQKH